MTATITPASPPTAPSPTPRWGPRAIALVALAVIATAVAMTTAGGAYEPSTPGLPDPGPIVGWGLPISRVLTDLAAALTAAWLIGAAFLDPAGRQGVVSPLGRADIKRTVVAAAVWAVLALVQMTFTVANVLGVPLIEAMNPDIISTYAMEIPTSRALAVTALVAAIISVVAVFVSATASAAVLLVLTVSAATLPTLAGHGSGLGDHALALSAGVAHVAAALVWIGGLIVLVVHGLRRNSGFSDAASLQRAASRCGADHRDEE